MKRQPKIIIIVLVAAAVIIAGLAYISNELFLTPNFVSAFYAYAAVTQSNTDYIEIDLSPLTVMCNPEASLEEYMMLYGGYTEIPESQMGLCNYFENESHTIQVTWFGEIYDNYRIWIIDEPQPKDD